MELASGFLKGLIIFEGLFPGVNTQFGKPGRIWSTGPAI